MKAISVILGALVLWLAGAGVSFAQDEKPRNIYTAILSSGGIVEFEGTGGKTLRDDEFGSGPRKTRRSTDPFDRTDDAPLGKIQPMRVLREPVAKDQGFFGEMLRSVKKILGLNPYTKEERLEAARLDMQKRDLEDRALKAAWRERHPLTTTVLAKLNSDLGLNLSGPLNVGLGKFPLHQLRVVVAGDAFKPKTVVFSNGKPNSQFAMQRILDRYSEAVDVLLGVKLAGTRLAPPLCLANSLGKVVIAQRGNFHVLYFSAGPNAVIPAGYQVPCQKI